MRSRILVVARDVALRARLARLLGGGGVAGCRVELAESAAHARRIGGLKGIDLALVDAGGLGAEGKALVAELQAAAKPILVLTAAAISGPSSVPGFETLDPAEESTLLSRVAEALRQQQQRPVLPSMAAESAPVLRFAGYSLDLAGHSLTNQAGDEIPLTRSEFALLREFAQRPGRVLSRDHLLDALAGREAEAFDRGIDMLVSRLRRKIEPDPKRPTLIATVSGEGYKFAARVEEVEAEQTPATVHAAAAERPSIVVLPFQNLSGSAEQEYFADGMVEDITTSLSRIRWLLVIARNTAFTYKGRAVDTRQVGRELGVRYVLEGSVRRAGNRVRITGQLIEVESNRHLWADRFDGDLPDIFDLQDRVTEGVARAIAPNLRIAEIERARRKPPSSLDAYDLYLRALPHFYATTREGNDEALRLLRQALALDPNFAAAAALASNVLVYLYTQGWGVSAGWGVPTEGTLLTDATTLAYQAAADDPNDAEVLAMAAQVIVFAARAVEDAVAIAGRAMSLNPDSAYVLSRCGTAYHYAGQSREAVEYFERSLRIDPLDPMAYHSLAMLSFAQASLGDYAAAVANARRAIQRKPTFATAWRALAASLALAGDIPGAQEAAHRSLALDPKFTITGLLARGPGNLPRQRPVVDGFRRAGLPE